jgi:hypothetical protein
MAISLAYGVALGTIFILLFFPVLIMILNDFRVYSRYLWTGIKPTPEEVETAMIQEQRRQRFIRNKGLFKPTLQDQEETS